MGKKYKLIGAAAIVLGFGSLAAWYLHRTNIPVLEPRGPVARQEQHLIILTLLLSLIVVVPVFSLLFVISWRYREGNPKKPKYSPDLSGNRLAETVWWLIPSAIILVIGVIIWNSSHTLDPFRPLKSATPPVTIQAIALDWKWLFIYPKQQIASVNFVQFPRQTPVNFQITSDTVMNSFWIPQLGSQIYAMPGMSTQLHLMADSDGSYRGSSANISGAGFAGMNFTARASSQTDFDRWVDTAKRSSDTLSRAAYDQLARPSQNTPVTYYGYAPGLSTLYDNTVMKYMTPAQQASGGGMSANSAGALSGMEMP